jgi:hypothetical protein
MEIIGSVRRVTGTGSADLLQAVRAASVGLLVVAANALPSDVVLDTLVERSACSILLVRG